VRPPQVKTSRAESKMMIMETKGRGLWGLYRLRQAVQRASRWLWRRWVEACEAISGLDKLCKVQDDDNCDDGKRLVRLQQVKTSRAKSNTMIMETKGRGLWGLNSLRQAEQKARRW
jgi:Na+-transporting NADH:ubiquinone oxidoreductase subunit NqrC